MTFLTTRFGDTDDNNSTTSTLTASSTYTGTPTDVENYGAVTVNITSDVSSSPSGLQIQFSSDSTNWDIVESYTYDKVSGPRVITSDVKARYYRIVFINGANDQTSFRLQTLIAKAKVGGVGTNNTQTITYGDNLLDGFGRLKISNPTTLLDVSHTKGKNNLLVHEVLLGGATSLHDANSSSVLMSVTSNGDRVVRQSRKKTIYQPGKSLSILLTGVLDAGMNGTDTISRMGYYDDNDGIFIEYNGTTINIVKRQNGSDLSVAQSAWNTDKVDGTGNSGVTIDASLAQIFFIDIEWLGVGTVRVGMFYHGLPIILHKFHHANISNNTYMQSANQPIRYEILANNTTAPSGSLRMICSTVISDGGYNPVGEIFSVNNLVNVADPLRSIGSDSIEPILNLRLKPIGATGAERKATVNLKQISITGNTANPNPRIAEIWLTQDQDDSILTSPSWISANDESAVEYDITSTVIDTTNSILIQSITFESRVPLTAPIEDSIISLTTNTETIGATGVSDIFSIVVNNPGGSIDILASATWEEIF